MHPDQTDKGSASSPADHPYDSSWPDASVGLVISVDPDRHTGAEHFAPTGVFGKTIEAG